VVPWGREQMTTDLFPEPEGATPLSPEDSKGLIPTWVATRADLNAAEQENIANALGWASTSRRMGSLESLMTEESIKTLHRRMGWQLPAARHEHGCELAVHLDSGPRPARQRNHADCRG
jgi:hypothetical protein